MKLVRGDGKEVTIRDVGPVLMTFRARPGGPPIKVNGWRIMQDEEARGLARELLEAGEYDHARG